MKIYFVYRTVYRPFGRYVKTFEADSVLDFFTRNWNMLSEDEESLFGISVYGFPIDNEDKDTPVPESIDELRQAIEENVYSNEVKVTEHAIGVLTDDDEVELMWAVFDEVFVQGNPKIAAAWLTPELPSEISTIPYSGEIEGLQLTESGDESCRTYYMSAVIYDSGNFDDLGEPVVFKGVSLSNLSKHLIKANVKEDEDSYYKSDEIRAFQNICKSYPDAGINELLSKYTGLEFDDISAVANNEVSQSELKESIVNESVVKFHGEHCVEVAAVSVDAYNYFVLFDDYWLAANKTLGESLILFFSQPDIWDEI